MPTDWSADCGTEEHRGGSRYSGSRGARIPVPLAGCRVYTAGPELLSAALGRAEALCGEASAHPGSVEAFAGPGNRACH